MIKNYYISQELIPNLIKLIIKDKPKNVIVSSYDLTYLRRNLRTADVSFDITTNKLRVKTGNKIRNPKDFSLFIDTYIESNLSYNPLLSPGNIAFKDFYTYSEYLEEALTKYTQEAINSQEGLDIETQGSYQETIIEAQSLDSVNDQNNKVISAIIYDSPTLYVESLQDKVISYNRVYQ